ncbi:hypothetical protein RJ639_037977 [Escallonia herrerae]|uniref:Fringe n=1 Tax=Escallonia herrerae TaxID=1293975 RepID=A0AA89BDX4_9ASTE|nr:hypothetical protein RJ639_037977 [Escallonia herrerae]
MEDQPVSSMTLKLLGLCINHLKAPQNPNTMKDLEAPDAMKRSDPPTIRVLPRFVASSFFVLAFTYICYTLILVYPSHSYTEHFRRPFIPSLQPLKTLGHTNHLQNPKPETSNETQLHHVFFGIAASAKLWEHRKDYIKTWWRPDEARGFVWLDKPVKRDSEGDKALPPVKISGDTSRFKYSHKKGDRSAIRISRIVSETVRLGVEGVRWIVLGDDDTVFVLDNLIRVLRKYDHNQFYYIGSSSESHIQNIQFSCNMAYGGGGFAISYALAKVLAQMQDQCIQRYPELYGSDDRIQACMTELGVPLTKEIGFHQFDVHGNVFGLLAAHPIAPVVSIHHLDLIGPIFPNVNQVQALQRLKVPTKLDSAALMQQSVCYDKSKNWTVSVSWGYTVQIFRGLIPARLVERPARTFRNWYPNADHVAFEFNSRPVSNDVCQRPLLYMLSNALYNPSTNQTASEYVRFDKARYPRCKGKEADISQIQRVDVLKKRNPNMWDKAPRRNCCRILPSEEKGTLVIDVDECREGELINST